MYSYPPAYGVYRGFLVCYILRHLGGSINRSPSFSLMTILGSSWLTLVNLSYDSRLGMYKRMFSSGKIG